MAREPRVGAGCRAASGPARAGLPAARCRSQPCDRGSSRAPTRLAVAPRRRSREGRRPAHTRGVAPTRAAARRADLLRGAGSRRRRLSDRKRSAGDPDVSPGAQCKRSPLDDLDVHQQPGLPGDDRPGGLHDEGVRPRREQPAQAAGSGRSPRRNRFPRPALQRAHPVRDRRRLRGRVPTIARPHPISARSTLRRRVPSARSRPHRARCRNHAR